jgi:serine-type D-Ala-D-Ala carboxypeptidase/endopeptidase
VPRAAESPAALATRAAAGHVRLAAGGVVDGEPVTWGGDPTALFQIGSVTKVVTSLLLATYVVDGELGLDQPVGELVEDLRGPATGLTLEQLATHTSGLPRIPRELWPRALHRHPDPYADVDHEFLLRSLSDVRVRSRSRPAYSNVGVGLLGHALARHARTSYDAVVQERVSGPLGLSVTACEPADPAPGHRRHGRPHRVAWRFDALAGCGALWSSVADLQRFLAAQLDPPAGRLGEAIRLTQQPRVAGRRMDTCLGWMRLHGRDGTMLWHNGGTAGFRSFVGVQGASAVAVLTASDRSVDGLGIQLLRSLAGG